MTVTDEIRSLAVDRAPAETIAQVAVREGMCRLREDGLEKVRRGLHVDRRDRARRRHRLSGAERRPDFRSGLRQVPIHRSA